MWLVKTAPDPVYENAVVLVDPAWNAHFELLPPYPNPFNSRTRITYNLAKPTQSRLIVCDLQGREIILLYNGLTEAGQHSLTWNSEGLSSGVYICRLSPAIHSRVKKWFWFVELSKLSGNGIVCAVKRLV